MTTVRRLKELGLSVGESAQYLGISLRQVEAQLDAEYGGRGDPSDAAGRTLMTPLLKRPRLNKYQARTAERL
jgi:hypothetical protein